MGRKMFSKGCLSFRRDAFTQKGQGVIDARAQHGTEEFAIDLFPAAGGRQEGE